MRCLVLQVIAVLISVFTIAQSAPILPDEATATLNLIALECIAETGVDKEVIEEAKTVVQAEGTPANDKKYKDFLACSYKKQGYLSSDGRTFKLDTVKEFLSQYYKKSDLEMLNPCQESVKADNTPDLAYNALNCILPVLYKIETTKPDGIIA